MDLNSGDVNVAILCLLYVIAITFKFILSSNKQFFNQCSLCKSALWYMNYLIHLSCTLNAQPYLPEKKKKSRSLRKKITWKANIKVISELVLILKTKFMCGKSRIDLLIVYMILFYREMGNISEMHMK